MKSKRLVYSTDQGRLCPACHQPVDECACKKQAHPPKTGEPVLLQRQSKGRKGKPVTLIINLPLVEAELKALAKELKNKCGVGGSIESGNILIQGEKRELLKTLLEQKGYRVKIAGG